MLDDEDEDELFELALAYFKLNAVHVSDPEVEPSPWAEETASDRRKRLDRLN
jgi:hypothetical protein